MGFYIALAESHDGGKERLSSPTITIIIELDIQNAPTDLEDTVSDLTLGSTTEMCHSQILLWSLANQEFHQMTQSILISSLEQVQSASSAWKREK